jgi:hypothetical protein
VTAETDVEAILGATSAIIEHVALESRVASSGVAMAALVALGGNGYLHAAGPLGLVGGYPVEISEASATIALPDGVTLEEAMKINEAGLIAGGIRCIRDDGTLELTEQAVEATADMFGVHRSVVAPAQIEDHAAELLDGYRQFLSEASRAA